MPLTLPQAALDPYDIAPASARKVSVRFWASPHGDSWEVVQGTTWKDARLDGWDGDISRVVAGLTEAEARAVVDELTGVVQARAA